MSAVLAADIGGTFTDVVVAAPDGRLASSKHLTTHDDPTDAVIAAVAEVLARAGVAPHEVTRVVHGTTLATNVILERKAAPVAFVVTEGFGDLLTLGRAARVEAERFDLLLDAAEPPVPRDRVVEVRERLDARGGVVVPLDDATVAAAVDAVAALDVAAVAVCLLHSYANAEHEQRLGVALRAAVGDRALVSLSSEVLPEVREYERATTTLLSAAVSPVMTAYLARLERRLAASGIDAPLLVMECSGGVMPASVAARRPVYTIESGPAAGVVAAQQTGARHGRRDVLSFDMGGTTAKAGVVRDGRPDITHTFHVGGHGSFGGRRASTGLPIKVPAIDLAEVGAGGGSIAWLDAAGSLHVGPRSAGSSPGPACYGLGGTEPTVTDADLVLGYLDAESFAGGSLPLDADAAHRAVERAIAAPSGVDVVAAADAVHRVANAAMAAAVHVVTVQRGIDPRGFALVALGGAAPMHACRVAEHFGIATVLVPPRAGVGSAMGLVVADLRADRAATFVVRSSALDEDAAGAVRARLSAMAADAAADVGGGSGASSEIEVEVEASVDVRYLGQGHEVSVPLATLDVTVAVLRDAIERFYRGYRDEYGIELRDPAEIVTLRVRAVRRAARASEDASPPLAPASGAGPLAARRSRRVCFDGVAYVDTAVHRRPLLGAGAVLAGPAVVEDDDTTVVVPPGWSATVEIDGTLRLDTGAEGAS